MFFSSIWKAIKLLVFVFLEHNSMVPAGDGSDVWFDETKVKAGKLWDVISVDIQKIIDAASK